MYNKVKEDIKKFNLDINSYIICGVSGGADSVSMIHILSRLGFKVVLAHVNHNMREQSKLEQVAMKNLAKELNCPFELLDYHFDNSGNFQAVAHEARYVFFKSLCSKYNTNIVCTAHHAIDQLETILMRILEGSNLYGYGGISSDSIVDEIRLIRPLLGVSKDEIYEYVKINNLETFEDSSNHEDHYLRNKIRHHVIPRLTEYSLDYVNKINTYSSQLKEAFSFIRNLSIKYLKEFNNIIDVNSFNDLDIALKKDIISLLLENNKINRSYKIIDSIIELLNNTNGSKQISLSNDYLFVRSYNKAYLSKKSMNNYELGLIDLNSKVFFSNYLFYFSKNMPKHNEKFIKLCYNTLELPLVVRKKQESDIIKLSVGSKKVSRVLIDAKVPKDQREDIPVIVNGNNEILWVYDYKKSKLVSDSKVLGDLYLICEVQHDAK